jgi:iron complex transport system ATP-binding protein
MTPVIDIEGLTCAAGDTVILRGVSMIVNGGEWYAVIGPNGAGKTTLLRCLIRINHAHSGTIRLAGRLLETYSQHELARLVSYVPQQPGTSVPFTVFEYVLMSRYPYLSPFTTFAPEDKVIVNEALELSGISSLSARRMDTLSGGERQTAAIAAALAQGGQVMLLDEPTTFLDPRHVRDISALIRRINRERGITIVMVTHDINSAALHADRIGVMRAGQFFRCGTPTEIITGEVLDEVYGMSFDFQPHPRTGVPLIVPEAGHE